MSHLRMRLTIAVAALVSLVAADAAFAHVVLSEFRTRGPEGGNDEFVELRNTGATAVGIGGWRLEGCASGTPGSASLRVAVPGSSGRRTWRWHRNRKKGVIMVSSGRTR